MRREAERRLAVAQRLDRFRVDRCRPGGLVVSGLVDGIHIIAPTLAREVERQAFRLGRSLPAFPYGATGVVNASAGGEDGDFPLPIDALRFFLRGNRGFFRRSDPGLLVMHEHLVPWGRAFR